MRVVVSKNGLKMLFPWDYIGKGTEGKVYKKEDYAYKCYHRFSLCGRLSLEETRFLEDISTERILLPRDTLYTCFGNFKGYTTHYIKNLGVVHYLELSAGLLVQDFHLLNCDCEILGKKKVVIYDLMPKDDRIQNYSFNRGLYFVDPGKYHVDSNLSEKESILANKKNVERFLYYRVINNCEGIGSRLSYEKLQVFRDVMSEHPGQLLDYISSDIQSDSLGEYVKRKTL